MVEQRKHDPLQVTEAQENPSKVGILHSPQAPRLYLGSFRISFFSSVHHNPFGTCPTEIPEYAIDYLVPHLRERRQSSFHPDSFVRPQVRPSRSDQDQVEPRPTSYTPGQLYNSFQDTLSFLGHHFHPISLDFPNYFLRSHKRVAHLPHLSYILDYPLKPTSSSLPSYHCQVIALPGPLQNPHNPPPSYLPACLRTTSRTLRFH